MSNHKNFSCHIIILLLIFFGNYPLLAIDQPSCGGGCGLAMDYMSGSGADSKGMFTGVYSGTPPVVLDYYLKQEDYSYEYGSVTTPDYTGSWEGSGYWITSYDTNKVLITNTWPENGDFTATTNGTSADKDSFNDFAFYSWNQIPDGDDWDIDDEPSGSYIYPSTTSGFWSSHTLDYYDGEYHGYITNDFHYILSIPYTTGMMEGKAQGQAAAMLATNVWTPTGGAQGGAQMASNEASCSLTYTEYRFRLNTAADTKYLVTWPVHILTTGPGTNFSETNTTMTWPVTGTGDEVTSSPYYLGATFPGDGQTTSMSVSAGEVCVQVISQGNGNNNNGGGCSSCGGAVASAGSSMSTPAFSSPVNQGISLGSDSSGYAIGTLAVNPTGPVQATPSILQIRGSSDSLSMTGSPDGAQQIRAPQALFNVVVNSNCQFDVLVYDTNNFSTNLSGGVYPVNGGGQTVLWRFENPGGATDTNDLRIIEVRGATRNTNLYTWSPDGTVITAISGNGLRKDVWTSLWDATQTIRTDTHEIRYTNDTQVFVQTNIYMVYSFGEALQSTTDGTGAAAKTTTYWYDGMGRISQVSRPDGTSDTYYYDDSGRISEKDGNYRSTKYGYAPLGGFDDGSFETNRARSVTNLYEGAITSIHYSVLSSSNQIEIDVTNVAAGWSDAGNLFTTNLYDTNGRISCVTMPDKTMRWYDYIVGPASRTNIESRGYMTDSGTFVTNSVITTIFGVNGILLSSTKTEDGYLTDQTIYTNYDALGRVGQINFLDQSSEKYQYECCGISAKTNRDGLVSTYGYDALKRISTKTEYGLPGPITWMYTYDPSGKLISTARQGTNGSVITLSSTIYDNSGHEIAAIDALSNTNLYSEGIDPYSSHLVKTNIHPDGGTVITEYDQDGNLFSVTGTASRPVSYYYTAYYDGEYVTIESLLNSSYEPTGQAIKTENDMVGRPILRTILGYASTQYIYNAAGQLAREIDPDNVSTLYAYNPKGEQVLTVLDLEQTGSQDLGNTNRATFTTNDVIPDYGVNVRRTRTYVWNVNGSPASNLVSTVERSVDGLQSWNTVWHNGSPITTSSRTVFASGGYRYQTNISADGSYTVNTYQFGKRLSMVRRDATNGPISGTTNAYDAHGRLYEITDARNGTTTYAFNDNDQVSSVTTPSPDGIQTGQTTTTYYDSMGRVSGIIQPDGTVVTNLYYPTGDLFMSYGSRTYPVAYSYDGQGRMTSMTNWSNFASGTGGRVTTWNYSYQGLLYQKKYDDGTGPTYTYTDAGRLSTRTWARNITTTYVYNNAGEIASVSYDDRVTPGITYEYDRLGNQTNITQTYPDTSTMVCAMAYNDLNQLLTESYTGGPEDGISVTNGYDSLLKRTNLVVLSSNNVLATTLYGYDAASRMKTVSDGTNSAKYSYIANSPLVSQILFQQSGTTRMTTTKQYDYLNRLTYSGSSNSSFVLDSHGYAYNTANQRTSMTNIDGTYWVYGYDFLGQVTSGVKYWPDGSIVAGQQFGYAFDDIGNRSSVSSGGDQWGRNLRYASYGANTLNQCTNRTVPGGVDIIGSATNTATVTVNNLTTYRKGNYYRVQLPVSNSAGPIWESVTNLAVLNSSTNYIIETNISGNIFVPQTPETFVYDPDGNLTSDGRWIYTWDGENRLISITNNANVPAGAQMQVNFTYDARGRRIGKYVITNGLTTSLNYAYDGWNLMASFTSGTTVAVYSWGLDLSLSLAGAGGVGGLLFESQAGNHSVFVSYDGNGNVSALADADTGNVYAEYEYGPFGENIRADGQMASNNPFRFSTKYQDAETDFIYYGYRYLDTTSGEWLNRDPVGEDGSHNLYIFCNNDGLQKFDLLGQLTIQINYLWNVSSNQFSSGAYGGDTKPRFSGWGESKSCTCGDMLSDYDLFLFITIRFKEGVTSIYSGLDGNGMTLAQHEDAHAQHWIDAAENIDAVWSPWANKCVPEPCFSKGMAYLNAVRAVQFENAQLQDDLLDAVNHRGVDGEKYEKAAQQDQKTLNELVKKGDEALKDYQSNCGKK